MLRTVEHATQQIFIKVQRGFGQLLSRPFFRHVGALTLANGVSAVLSFVQGILVARWLGPELYGVAALIMSVPALVHTFFDARSVEASVKYLSEFHAREERERTAAMCRLGYFIDFSIATLAFLGVLAIAPWASRAIIHRPELGWLLIVYAFAFLPRALQGTSYAVLAVHRRFTTVALIETFVTGVRVALVLGLVIAGWDVTGVVCGNAVGIALIGILYTVPAYFLMSRSWGSIPWSETWVTLKGYRREIIRFLAYNDLNALLGMIPKQLDVVLLGYFRNPTEVGFYKLAKSLAATVGYLVGPLQSVAYPELARLWAIGNPRAFMEKVRKLAIQVGLPLGLSVFVGIALLPWLISFLVGAQYEPTIFPAQLLLEGVSIWLVFFWLRPVYLAKGAVRLWTIGILIYTIAFVTLALILIPSFGVQGVAMVQFLVTGGFHIGMWVALYATSGDSRKSV